MAHTATFDPIYKERIWGGRRLEALFARALPPGVKIGESWELADLPEGKSVVSSGPARGRRIDELVRRWGRELLGSVPPDGGQFPLLVKYLDATDDLSVQVHPDYASAERMGGAARAKCEAWFVVAAEPNAKVYRGLQPGVTRSDVERAIRDETLAELLTALPARPGDWFYLPGGTVHALGAGLVVAEVQTPSDTTFRLYDWGRIDPKTGRGRDLHVEQALACLDFHQPELPHGHAERTFRGRLVEAPTFTITKGFLPAGATGATAIHGPLVRVVLEGSGVLGDRELEVEFTRGQTMLVPAAAGEVRHAIRTDCSYLDVELKART